MLPTSARAEKLLKPFLFQGTRFSTAINRGVNEKVSLTAFDLLIHVHTAVIENN
jgi:hypothetical protein